MCALHRSYRLVFMLTGLLMCVPIWAGAPFVTDDPEPVELHHWEIYLATQGTHAAGGTSGTLPQIDLNTGAAPNLQLHILVPLSFNNAPGGSPRLGYGDTELGVKYRFIQESDTRPMVGIYPMLELPTGSETHGFGSGHTQLFLPVWVQKSWGPWKTYGGGGYHTNPGDGNKHYWLLGWVAQRDINTHVTVGGELFYTTATATDAGPILNWNLGGQYNFNEDHHVAFSGGRSLHGNNDFMYYLGYLWTLGPADVKGK